MADRSVSVVLKANVAAYQRAMAQATGSTVGLQGATEKTSGTAQRMGSLMQGAKVLGGVYALKKGFDATVGAAVAFETAFTGVTKTVEGTPAQLSAIESGLRGLSKEIPVGTTELAGLSEAAGQLGIETPNVLSFTETMAGLGEASANLSGEQAAQSLARLANITQMSQDDFDRLGSTIVALGNNMATTEAEIVDMSLRIAGAGSQIGLAESEILGVAAALSSVGIPAEAGGSAISRVMIKIADAVATGNEKLQTFADVAGMSAEQFQAAFQQDAPAAILDFVEGLGTMIESGQSTTEVLEAVELQDLRVADALRRAAGAGDLMNRSLEIGNDAWRENVALTEEVEKRYGTTASQIQIAKNNLSDLGISVGQVVLPALGAAAEGLTEFIQIADRFNEGEPIIQRLGNVMNPISFVQEWRETKNEMAGAGTEIRSLEGELNRFQTTSSLTAVALDEQGVAAENAAGEVAELAGTPLEFSELPAVFLA